MDPNATLDRIRVAVEAIRTNNFDTDAHSVRAIAYAVELADAVADLDGWLTRGGFVPAAWVTDGHGSETTDNWPDPSYDGSLRLGAVEYPAGTASCVKCRYINGHWRFCEYADAKVRSA